ncbi:TonB-dependent receptor plug [Denitrovibrio acetiphilus DSM 12809]|uniref:TonB-dependent receptor plug n=1 Tax=Denitrovibrio acetiphilus (strain DSM 12809 / NBRC 114555 / N2460) TaxID=522772 RepID=D4H5I5_DENA2|nr:TonB-dependent receptor [Denitrovibrio acetiphilus]ADD67605.1 TonB-dependent receptor plug [Denitrovibrio acetiphilus DSM 12809]
MRKSILALMSVCLCTFNVWASDINVQTEEVEVTATRTKKVAKEVPMSLSVVGQEEIKKSTVTSVADLLKDLPGVQLTSTGSAGIYRLSLRGESGSRALVMVDGIKISEQKSMDGAPLLIDINSIERIEVIKGPASVLYGSEAIGGAINIISKRYADKPIQGMISSTYNSGVDGISSYVTLYGSTNGFYYRGEGTKTKANNREDTDGDEIENTEFSNTNMRFLVGYQNDAFDIGIEHTSYRSNNEVSTGLEDAPTFAMDMELPVWNRRKTSVYAEYKKPIGAISKIRLDAYQQKTLKEFDNNMYMTMAMGPVTTTMESLSNTENDLITTGVNLQVDFDITDTNMLIAGVEIMKDELDVDESKKTFGAPVYSSYHSEAEQLSKAFFIHDEQMLGENFILSGGLRYTSIDSELTDTDNPSYEKNDSNDSSTVGSLALVYTGVKNTAFRALYSRGYRTPNLQQLYMGTTHGSTTPTYSNPDLDSEVSNNFEVGVRFDNKKFDADLALFYNKAKDYITTILTTRNGSDARVFTNVDEATTKGAELTTGYRIADFRPYLTGTYLHKKYETDGFSTTKNGMPETFGRAGVTYDRAFGQSAFGVDIYARYAGRAEEESSTGDVTKTGGYTTYNLQLDYTYAFESGRRFMVTAEALNINNKEYQLAMSTLEETGRHYTLKASLEF